MKLTATKMIMPNFLIIGAAKAGTTSLYNYLKEHPQIYMSPVKEPRFFYLMNEKLDFRGPGDENILNSSTSDLEDYSTLFQGVSNEIAIGEASSMYLYHPKTPKRIKSYVPDVKMITILRDPVERAYSHFLMNVKNGLEPLTDFVQVLQEEEIRIRSNWGSNWHHKARGFYYSQVKRYFDIFDRSQIKIYLYEDLKTN
nr:sulfotransferase [Xenococcaceae cyanobacterium MO_188.B19]